MEVHEYGGDPENKTEVAHPVREECLEAGKNRGLALEPEPDKQVGDQAHALPAEKQLHEIV